MESERSFRYALEAILENDERYSADAYVFVRRALDYTSTTSGIKGHVTGQELLEGIRQYTMEKFGPMSRFLLEEWGIVSCEDFGNIVFNMVDAGLLGKTEEDSIDDFRVSWDFYEVFEKPFQ
jgi:uncharacterized repeat protein (TIGR04138 family)